MVTTPPNYEIEPFLTAVAGLPDLLATVQPDANGQAVAADILARAGAFVNLPPSDQHALLVAVVEEGSELGGLVAGP